MCWNAEIPRGPGRCTPSDSHGRLTRRHRSLTALRPPKMGFRVERQSNGAKKIKKLQLHRQTLQK